MTATAAMARPKAPFYRSRTSRNYRRTAENALFAGLFRPFYYRNLCIKNVVLIDPCMGSGHILVYAFDVLMQIYEAAGYTQREAAKCILENNIYGLDIDDRAFQLAYFAVMMKARQYNRRILNGETVCHVYSIQESNTVNRAQLKYFGAGLNDLELSDAMIQITGLLDTFVDAKEYGSILNVDVCNWDLLRRFVAETNDDGQMTLDFIGLEVTQGQLQQLIQIGQGMAQKYDVVVTNPPYMGTSNGNGKLNRFVVEKFPRSKADLYSVFIEQCERLCDDKRFFSMITQQSWLSLPSFLELRKVLYSAEQFVTVMELGARAFDEISGEVVSSVAFTFRKNYIPRYTGIYSNLQEGNCEAEKERLYLSYHKLYYARQDDFAFVPNMTMVYDVPESALRKFKEAKPVSDYVIAKPGMQTSDNERFLRLWFEVITSKIGFGLSHDRAIHSEYKWFPYNKGIGFRKWFGNNDYIVNFYHDGEELKYWLVNNPKDPGTKHWSRNMRNYDYYFQEGITFTAIGNAFSARLNGKGYLFDTKGPTMFGEQLVMVCGFVNSVVFDYYNRMLCKQLTKSAESVNLVPMEMPAKEAAISIEKMIDDMINASKRDWNSYETSWDFTTHPLTRSQTISEAFTVWEAECAECFNTLKANEEELNRIFINIYGLQDELTPKVEDKEVTVRKADLQRDIKSLLSYAVGCMFGRYSLDVSGLAYAGGEWDDTKYHSFIPKKDNILPITDEEYFEEDILGLLCSWLKKVYGVNTLEENLDFIAKALGNKGNTSREIIRNYFLNYFFKDHCSTYSVTGSGKRPIYWLFDSGKQNGFKALVYMHRYDDNTIGNLRIDYLHRMERVYENEIARMQDIIDNSRDGREITKAIKRKEKLQKQIKECKEYDEKIAHLALARISIDLDDGVKVNYEKVQTVDGRKYPVLAKI